MPDIDGGVRARIATFLPDALGKALQSYEDFLDSENKSEAKDFKAHHDACKTAIAHLELLIKLAEKMDVFHVSDDDKDDVMADMLRRAQAEIKSHEGSV